MCAFDCRLFFFPLSCIFLGKLLGGEEGKNILIGNSFKAAQIFYHFSSKAAHSALLEFHFSSKGFGETQRCRVEIDKGS